MNNHDQTRPSSPRAELEQAINLAKSGQKEEACRMLRAVVAQQPVNQAAWLWLSAITAHQTEAKTALAQAKRIDPGHSSLPRAEQWLVHRFSPAPTTKKSPVVREFETPVQPTKSWRNLYKVSNSVAIILVAVAAVIGLVVLFLGVIWEVSAAPGPKSLEESPDSTRRVSEQISVDEIYLADADAALAQQDWLGAIATLKKHYRSEPDSQVIRDRLAEAYFHNGMVLRKRGFVEEAVSNLEQALEINSGQESVEQELRLASAYLAGTRYYQSGQWQSALIELETIWAIDKTYVNVRDLLYSAYYNLGLAQQATGNLREAKKTLELASALHPDLSGPHRLIAEIEFSMAPQTALPIPPTPVPLEDRAIVVGIAEQRMAVYEGDKQIFDFIVSTGEPGRATAVGEFEILNKIDVAYASTWNLDMPYWMGIYWAGSLQNGIHSLPIVKHTGYKLWDGFLGQRVSYGCVILSDDDAAILYDWAEVGTSVKIVPSLESWTPEN